MLPRPHNATTMNLPNKPKTLQPTSLLSFGIRTYQKQKLNPKTSNKDAKPLTKMVNHSGPNLDKNRNYLEENQNSNQFNNYLDLSSRRMQNQNQEFKHHSQNDMNLVCQNNPRRKIFSDQIVQKPNLLKLNNMTNIIDISQKQSFKDNSIKNQQNLFLSQVFLQDNLFEDDHENKTQKIYVDMKKKIKKISKSKRLFKSQRIQEVDLEPLQNEQQKKRREMAQHHKQLMKNAVLDSEVIIDSSMFCNKIINHRVDNDVDTDDEQITSGLKRLKKSLEDAVQQNKTWTIQKSFMMQNQQDSFCPEQFQGQNFEYFQ